MNLKNWIGACVAMFLLLATGMGVVTYEVDPLQLYRRATSFTPGNEYQQRLYSPGFARHYDYNTIIIGTSMTENFKPSEIDKILSVKSIKLSISGGTAYEQGMITKTALDTGKVENIIWGLDLKSFIGSSKSVRYDIPLPEYLYDEFTLNDYNYLLNYHNFFTSCGIILTCLRGECSNNYDRDRIYYWGDVRNFSKQELVSHLRPLTPPGEKDNRFDLANLKNNFKENVEPLIRSHPGVNYYLFFPPYSILEFNDWMVQQYLNDALEFKKYIAVSLDGLKNVVIFDFQTETTITHDGNIYSDYAHYHAETNTFIINSIAQKKYIITKSNVDECNRRLQSQVANFSVKGFIKL